MTAHLTLVCDDTPNDVLLLDVGPSPLEVTKAFRALTGLGLWCAKQTVTDVPPVLLFEGIEEDVARQHAERLCAASAGHGGATSYKAPRLINVPSGPST